MAARGVALAAAALLAAGCGRTYTAQETAAALRAQGVKVESVFSVAHTPLPFSRDLRCGHARPFAQMRLAVENLAFDYFYALDSEVQVHDGAIEIFCGRYDAERFVEVMRELAAARVAVVDDRHVFRRANVVLVEGRRSPALEAAFAKLRG